ncbi:MAG: hypothetical protein SGARI_005671 [Bacillariaceae sp.]
MPSTASPTVSSAAAFRATVGYKAIPFPWRLHDLLNDASKDSGAGESIVSWLPQNNGFKIHDKAAFEKDIMPLYFPNAKLNMWLFKRTGCQEYTHELFVRDKPDLCKDMKRVKIKGKYTRQKSASSLIGNLSPRTANVVTSAKATMPSLVSFESIENVKSRLSPSVDTVVSSAYGNHVWPQIKGSGAHTEWYKSEDQNKRFLFDKALRFQADDVLQDGDRLGFAGNTFFFVEDDVAFNRRTSLGIL